MSTSPSWFDQEKFSRLVKKVGPKTGSEATSPLPQVSTETEAPIAQEGLASTARISLVSRPPSLLNEHRALPALPRRTGPMPGLKSIFKYPGADAVPAATPEPKSEPEAKAPAVDLPEPKPEPKLEVKSGPLPAEAKAEPKDEPKIEVKTGPMPAPPLEAKELNHVFQAFPEVKPAPKFEFKPEPLPEPSLDVAPGLMGSANEDDLDAIWHKMALLNEELAQTVRERDQAFHDNTLLREQLDQAEEALEQKSEPKSEANPGQTAELKMLTSERDLARKEYADVRKQYEELKREQNPGTRTESLKFRKELEQQLEGFRTKLEERNKEIATLKAASGAGSVPAGEVAALREQLTKAREEASVAQRGLALSQKALHETRMTLREATEGTSLSRHNFDNLKAECAALTQQNTVLQAQNDQLSRELAAAKSKLTTRL